YDSWQRLVAHKTKTSDQHPGEHGSLGRGVWIHFKPAKVRRESLGSVPMECAVSLRSRLGREETIWRSRLGHKTLSNKELGYPPSEIAKFFRGEIATCSGTDGELACRYKTISANGL